MRQLTQSGVTLIELMVGIAIAALLALSAGPFFADYNANSRLRESGHLLYTEALAAQSEAIKRNGTVSLVVRTADDTSSLLVIDQATPDAPLRSRVLSAKVRAGNGVINFGGTGAQTPLAGATAVTVEVSMQDMSCSSDLRCPALKVEVGGGMKLCNNKLSC